MKIENKGYSLQFTFEPKLGDVTQHSKKPEMIRKTKQTHMNK